MNHHQQNGSINLDSDLHSSMHASPDARVHAPVTRHCSNTSLIPANFTAALEYESRIRVHSRSRRPARNRIVVIVSTSCRISASPSRVVETF